MKLIVKLPGHPLVPFEAALIKDGQHVMSSNSVDTNYDIHSKGVYRVIVRVFPTLTLPDGQRWPHLDLRKPILFRLIFARNEELKAETRVELTREAFVVLESAITSRTLLQFRFRSENRSGFSRISMRQVPQVPIPPQEVAIGILCARITSRTVCSSLNLSVGVGSDNEFRLESRAPQTNVLAVSPSALGQPESFLRFFIIATLKSPQPLKDSMFRAAGAGLVLTIQSGRSNQFGCALSLLT